MKDSIAELVRLLYQRHQDMGDTLARKAAWEIERLREYIAANMKDDDLARENVRLIGERERLRAALEKSKRSHYYCEDTWYSCPKHPEGCSDEYAGKDCNCGADRWNAYVDGLLAEAAPRDETKP